MSCYLEDDGKAHEEPANRSVSVAIQNMLPGVEDIGLSGVLLGEIEDCRDTINIKLGIAEKYNLAAMLAIGYSVHRNQKSHRKHINDCILKTIGGYLYVQLSRS